LAIWRDLHVPNLTAGQAADLMARAHEHCPYSVAARDNIEVTLTVDGLPLPKAADTVAS
jgi:lipoyl-dependent peroxiredoxin